MKHARAVPFARQLDCRISASTRRASASKIQAVAALGLASALLLAVSPGTGSGQEKQMSARASRQIQVQLDEKASRTPAQRKIGSNLLQYLQAEQDKSSGNAMRESRPSIQVDEDGTTLVDIKANVTQDLLNKIEEAGGTVVNSFPQFQSIRARILIRLLERIAESPDVRSIRSADEFQLHKLSTSEDDLAPAANPSRR